jgi:hypothetical protein
MQYTFENNPVMVASVSYSYPDQHFWIEYTALWNNSLHKPVFKSPHYIQYLANRFRDDFAVYKFVVDDKLMGVTFLRKNGNDYRLLTDVKADHNFFVIHQSCTAKQIETFFVRFLALVKQENWSLVLRVQPLWASYMATFVKAVNTSGLFWNVAKRSVCPVLEEETAKILYDKLNASRELRYRVSRIKSQLKGEFEILTGEEDMDSWVNTFCELHRKRWDGTGSPSRYQNAEEENFLKNCLLSWAKDRVLVRFAIKAGGERIAFVICLLQQNSLIHHSTAYDETFYKYSPGKALILIIAEWMKGNNLNILDFGEGAESYKYAYTNKELELNEISISAFSNVSFMLKVKLRQVLREKISANPNLIRFYKEKIKPLTHREKV